VPGAAHPPFAWPSIRPAYVALGLALAHLLLALLSILPDPHNGGDNAAYLALSQSIREQGSYRELWDPSLRPHTQYPPGYPLMLAAAMTLGVGPWAGFKVMVALFSATAVGFSYLWLRRLTTAGTALAVAALLAFTPGVVDLARWELSDPPFWAFTMLGLWAFAALPRRATMEVSPEAAPAPPPAAEARPWWKTAFGPLALASVGTLLAYATRSAGLPLVMAGVVWLAWQRRWTRLAVFIGVVAPFAVAWWLRNRAAGGAGYTSFLWYVDPYRPMLGTVGIDGLLSRMVVNVEKYAGTHLPYLLTGTRGTWLVGALGVTVTVLALAGWVMRVRRPGLAELWLPLYMGLVLIWPSEWAGDRFILPALPMLLLCAAEPVRWLLGWMPRPWPRVAGTAIVAVLLVAGIGPLTRQISTAADCRAAVTPSSPHPCVPEAWADLLDVARLARGALPDSAVVLSRKATLFWAYSGYASRTYPFTDNPDTLLAAARDAGARYVLLDYIDNLSVLYLSPVLMQRPQAFCVVHAVGPGRATLMAIVPGAERMRNVRDRPGNEAANLSFPQCTSDFWAPGRAPPSARPPRPTPPAETL
jgi:hypothetical protein